MIWAGGSVLFGLVALRTTQPFWRAFGTQSLAWGAIDAAIALGGQQVAERKQVAATPQVEFDQARQLRWLLWLNTGLDVFYVLGGAALHGTSKGDASRKGHAVGIMVQGAFLFLFDLWHALHAPRLRQP
jgi:hypothetical protein